MVCKRVFLSGKVQGVSFRFHTFEVASKQGVRGWVRNNEDGRVEMLLIGTDKAVEEVIKWARKGPALAKVERVEVRDESAISEGNEPFYIKRDGGK